MVIWAWLYGWFWARFICLGLGVVRARWGEAGKFGGLCVFVRDNGKISRKNGRAESNAESNARRVEVQVLVLGSWRLYLVVP